MRLTEEQENIIEASRKSRSLVVNALAGSGKTSTAIECVKANAGRERKIIYLSFNRSVAVTMQEKLSRMGVNGPEITTLHSLAFRRLGKGLLDSGRKLGNLKPWDIRGVCKNMFRTVSGKKIESGYVMNSALRLVLDRIDGFMGSSSLSLSEYLAKEPPFEWSMALEKLSIDPDCMRRAAASVWKAIVDGASDFPLTHGAYLKLFHMQAARNPGILDYDLAIVDEAQDLFPVTEDIVRIMGKSGARLVFFGDRYQQIYTWNGSVNSIQRFEDESDVLALTQSFRCPGPVVREASKYLSLLGYQGAFRPAPFPCSLRHKSPILISRTNSSLFANIAGCQAPLEKVFLVGGVQSYNFDAISDYLNFSSGRREKIKSPVVASFENEWDYDEYAESAGDMELKNARMVVKKLGHGKTWELLTAARKNAFAQRPEEADICLSTGHKCKGSEFESVAADASFRNVAECPASENSDDVKDALLKASLDPDARTWQAEELRLAYVTLTRSTDRLSPGPLFLDDEAFARTRKEMADGSLVLLDRDENGDSVALKPLEFSGKEEAAQKFS